MKQLKYSDDYNNRLFAEMYDKEETFTDDVELILNLLAGQKNLRILECFCGTGRISIPLAQAGHFVTGIDIAEAMVERARMKAQNLPMDVQQRLKFVVADVLEADWGQGYDMVIIGCNAFYELPKVELQERCIALAKESLKPNGLLYVDNDDYRGGWEKEPFGVEHTTFEGTVADGTYVKITRMHVDFDPSQRLLKIGRAIYKTAPDGEEIVDRYVGQKRPVNAEEVSEWIEKNGFEIMHVFGDWKGNPHNSNNRRAIFLAQRVK